MLPVDRTFYLKDDKINRFLIEISPLKFSPDNKPEFQQLVDDLNRKTREGGGQSAQGDLYGLTLQRFKEEGPVLTGLWDEKRLLLPLAGHRARNIASRVNMFKQHSSMLQRYVLSSPVADNIEIGRLALLQNDGDKPKRIPLDTYYIKVNKLALTRSEKILQFLRAHSPLVEGPPYTSGLNDREALVQYHLMG